MRKRGVQRWKKQIRNYNLEQALEITVKIIIDGLLTFVAFTAIVVSIKTVYTLAEK